MIAWLHRILSCQLIAAAKELLIIGYAEIEGSLAIGIEIGILTPVGYLGTSRT